MGLLRCLALLTPTLAAAQGQDYSQYVNPFIGGEGYIPGLAYGGGDIFVGGARPFGVVKAGIDTYETNISFSTINGGWTPEGLVTGVSMMHESGTGGSAKYGIISQMPLTNLDAPVNILDNSTYWQERVGNDSASVGYFKTSLKNDVDIQIGGARHSAIFQYDFPAGEKYILADVSHFLPSETGSNTDQYYAGGLITIEKGNKVYTGYGTYGGGEHPFASLGIRSNMEQASLPVHRLRHTSAGSSKRRQLQDTHSEAETPLQCRDNTPCLMSLFRI